MSDAALLPVIDADCHVVEPFDLWQQLPAAYRDRGRRRRVGADGREEIVHEGAPLQLEWTVGSLATPGSGRAGGRLDIDLDTEVDRAVHDPHHRLELMDHQGIAVSVLFPSISLGVDDIVDAGYRHAHAELYNRWIAAFCDADPQRLRWGAVLPLQDVEWACRELDACLALGASCAMLSAIPRSKPNGRPFADPLRADGCRNLGHPELDPLYARLADAGVPAVSHAMNPASNALGIGWLYANRAQWQMGQPFQMQLAVLHVLDGGVLERHPSLRYGFFEGDVGWLPHWLGRLEETYEKFALLSRTPAASPVELFRRQCVISGEPADRGLRSTVDLVGADRVLFASDWPHMDGAWPDPITIVRARPDLTDDDRRAMLVTGPARFFGIDLDCLVAHLGPAWSLGAPIASLRGMLAERP